MIEKYTKMLCYRSTHKGKGNVMLYIAPHCYMYIHTHTHSIYSFIIPSYKNVSSIFLQKNVSSI